MIELAVKNGIGRKNYFNRIAAGWGELRAATQDVRINKTEYAMYKNDEFVFMGNLTECAKFMGVDRDTVSFYTTPTYQRRLDERKDTSKSTVVIKLDE